MFMEQMSLARQIDLVFRQVMEELGSVSSGIVFVQIRNNMVGKFGLKHDPIDTKEGGRLEASKGLSEEQQVAFRKLALDALKRKTNWTHGEIQFEFAIRQNVLVTSIQFESHYNMAAIVPTLRQAH